MRPRSGGRRILLGLGAVLFTAGATAAALQPLGWADASPRRHDARTHCDFAVTIDGALRCDEEVPAALAELCGSEELIGVQPGDALELANCSEDTPVRGSARWGRMSAEKLTALGVPLDINTATASDLTSLPGIGPRLATRIEAGRPYGDASELERVRGIGPVKLGKLAARLRVEPMLMPRTTPRPSR